jgi:hypothetical protein
MSRRSRTIKAAPAPAWIGFAGAAQVAQLRRTVTRNGKKTVEVICLITTDRNADPGTLAAWARGHWHIGNKLHWVRDFTYQTVDLGERRAMARPRFPDVDSTTRVPGRIGNCAARAASNPAAVRNLMEPVGLHNSSLSQS